MQGRPSLKDMHHRRASEQTPTEEVKIFGDFKELAYYYADVFVGTPPQKVTVITDTGSTLLAFPCTGCSHCGSHMDPRYDASRSSTSSEVGCGGGCPGSCSSNQCTYHVAYAEGSSISGYYHEDLVWIGDETTATVEAGAQYGTRYKFGCHTQETSMHYCFLALGCYSGLCEVEVRCEEHALMLLPWFPVQSCS